MRYLIGFVFLVLSFPMQAAWLYTGKVYGPGYYDCSLADPLEPDPSGRFYRLFQTSQQCIRQKWDPAGTVPHDLPIEGTPECSAYSQCRPSPYSEPDTKNDHEQRHKDEVLSGADPIDTPTGAQVINQPLLRVRGVIPIEASLYYHGAYTQQSPAGIGWTLAEGYNAYLEFGHSSIDVVWSQNRQNTFIAQGPIAADGSRAFATQEVGGIKDRFQQLADGRYRLERDDRTVYIFSSNGRLQTWLNAQQQPLHFEQDAEGRLIRVTEPVTGVFIAYHYSSEGRLWRVSDSLNRQVYLTQDENNQLLGITDAVGNIISYTYDADGHITGSQDDEGRYYFQNTYDDQFRIVTQADGRADTPDWQLTYTETRDENAQPIIVTDVTDRRGKTRVYRADGNFRPTEITDELGNPELRYVHDENGRVTRLTDALDQADDFVYDADGNLTEHTDALGRITRYEYDERRNRTAEIDALGRRTSYSYDTNNRLISVIDAEGQTSSISYNDAGQILEITSPAGRSLRYEYENGFPVRRIDGEGNISSFVYDAAGRVKERRNAFGHRTQYVFDRSDRLVTLVDARNRRSNYRYDSRNRLLEVVDARGNSTTHEYDGNGNRVLTRDALGQEWRYVYDASDRLIERIDPQDKRIQYEYDAKGRLIAVIDGEGNRRELEYDDIDRLQAAIDALNQRSEFRYDAVGNLLETIDRLGNVQSKRYDDVDRLIENRDRLDRLQQYGYDDLDRLTQTINALGGESTQSYNADGDVIDFSDPLQQATRFAYDDNGQALTETTAADSALQNEYDARNYLVKQTDGRGNVTRLYYDELGRMTRYTDPVGSKTLFYDNNGNLLTLKEHSRTHSRRVYDALNRVTEYENLNGDLIGYAYDASGNLSAITYPDGKQVSYGYDQADRLTRVTDWAGRITFYSYDANSRLVRTERPNGTIEAREYDAEGRLTLIHDQLNGQTLARHTQRYDAEGNITEETHIPSPQPYGLQDLNLSYGAGNRLNSIGSLGISYDADGNMIHGPVIGGQKTLAYDLEHDWISGQGDYVYDARSRLIAAGGISYEYDAEDQRIAQSKDGQRTTYVINPEAALSQVLVKTAPDGTRTYYVYGLGLIGAQQGGDPDAEYQSYHYDLRGSTVALSNAQGQITDRFEYSPFGLLTHHSGNSDTPFLYNGRDGVQTDANGLYYERQRYYHPSLRRFINRDLLLGSILNSQSLNRYAYVQGNPVRWIDPYGLAPEDGNKPLKREDFENSSDVLGIPGPDDTVQYEPTVEDRMLRDAFVEGVGWIPVVRGGRAAKETVEFITRPKRGMPDPLPIETSIKPKAGSSGGAGAGKGFPEKIKEEARKEANDQCVFCGIETIRSPKPHPQRSHTDHAEPKSRGGNNSLDNAQNTCQRCNLEKGKRTTQEYLDYLKGEANE